MLERLVKVSTNDRWDEGAIAGAHYSQREILVGRVSNPTLKEILSDLNWELYLREYFGGLKDFVQQRFYLEFLGRFKVVLPIRRFPDKWSPGHWNLS